VLNQKFRSLAPVRVRVRVFCSGLRPKVPILTGSSGQAPEVLVGAVYAHARVRENCFGFRLEVPVLAPEVPVNPS
jgi:hypothetical protein